MVKDAATRGHSTLKFVVHKCRQNLQTRYSSILEPVYSQDYGCIVTRKMAQPLSKKRKVKDHDGPSHAQPGITDPRFSNIQSDPRYRLPSKRRAHVKVDKRFSHMLRDDDFGRKAKVDRYGRPLEDDSERKRLKKRYEFEDDIDDDNAVQQELKRVEKVYDPIRDGGFSESSSDESSSEEDDAGVAQEDQHVTLGNQQYEDVPMGDVSSRVAVVNLDWDNIRAADLMAVFSSFLPSGGRLLKVSIYPSQFGKERMAREETEGPPKEIFASVKGISAEQAAGDDDDDEQQIKDPIVQADAGEDFDSAALRQYQLQRLQYFYAVLTFSSPETAQAVYDAIDGTEYLTTANFFDLRFIPDGTDFSDVNARDECEKIPDRYKPNEFVTDALQHSNVKLTWDTEDASRKEAQAKAFRGSRKDIDENDLKAYLGSDSSSDEEARVDNEAIIGSSSSRKEQERQKMRSLLGLDAEPKRKIKSDVGPVGDLQITFSSGLSGANNTKKSVFENEPELEETTVERYARKERERRQKRKERMKQGRDGASGAVDVAIVGKSTDERPEDLGFDDPFFTAPEHDKTSAAKMRKEERLRKRTEREAEEASAAAQRSELELLMVDDNHEGKGMRHFDMNEIEREERKAKKKGKKSKSQKEGQTPKEPQSVGFEINTQDSRFARLYENHEYAIDPTNPRFKGTEGMKALLEEGRKYKNKIKDSREDGPKKATRESSSMSKTEADDVKKLVEKVKSRRKDEKT
jgi:NUC153 domain